MRRLLIAALIVLGLFPVDALAWGGDGHRIVCRLAFLLLNDTEKQEVIRLTTAFQRPDGRPTEFFTDGCTFPDEARAKVVSGTPGWEQYARFNNQHFVNLPRTSDEVSDADCRNDCVLTGIASQADALKNGANDQARAEALFFLGHFIGDIHQPLHVSFADDKGGNDIKPISGGVYTSGSLHSVWDSGIIIVAMGNEGWRVYGESLLEDLTDEDRAEWILKTPEDWANESFRITRRKNVLYCDHEPHECAAMPGGRTLRRRYQTKQDNVVEMRLLQAGVRLANEISKAFAP